MEPTSIIYSIATSVALMLNTATFSPDMKILELSGPVEAMTGYVDPLLSDLYVDTLYFDTNGECMAFRYMKRDDMGRIMYDNDYNPTYEYSYINNDQIAIYNKSTQQLVKYYYDGSSKLVRKLDVSKHNARLYGCDTLAYSFRYERIDEQGNWLQRTQINDMTGATELQTRKIMYYDPVAPKNDKAMFDVSGPVKSINRTIIAHYLYSSQPVTFTPEGEVSRVANYIYGHDTDNNLAYLQSYDPATDWVENLEVLYDDNRRVFRVVYAGAPDESAAVAHNVTLYYDAEGRLSKIDGIEMEEYTALYYTTTIEYTAFDSYNNWTARKLTTQYLYTEEMDSGQVPVDMPVRSEVQNRVIEYYQ